VRSVAAQGHEVHVLLPLHREWARPEREGSVHYHPYRYSPVSSWTPWGFSASLEGGTRIRKPLYALAPFVVAAALRKASRLLADQSFDLINVHWVVPNGPIGARLASRRKLPLVVSLHGSDVSVSEQVGAIGRLTRRTFSRAAAVTAPSVDLLERARRLGATALLELIPYGADVEALHADAGEAKWVRSELGIPADATVVAAVGRFVRWKGFDHLIEAVAKAASSAPTLRLILVGDGDLRDELVARTRALRLDDVVRFTGMIDRRALPGYFAASDIVVVPSVHHDGYVDGLPNVALEAMAAGKALVATQVGGLPQLIRNGENGVLVDEKDSDALAAALVRLAGDPGQRAQLGTAARQEIRERRSWDMVGRRFVEIYERALAAR
jgi:glycosyltransferase involved in cell wall biosynthesis